MRQLDEALRRLQIDHLDLWQVHECVYDNDPERHFADAVLQGPEVAKLSPGAIWSRLGQLSRKRCSGTKGEQGEAPDFAGLGTRDFPEDDLSRESSGPPLVSNPLTEVSMG